MCSQYSINCCWSVKQCCCFKNCHFDCTCFRELIQQMADEEVCKQRGKLAEVGQDLQHRPPAIPGALDRQTLHIISTCTLLNNASAAVTTGSCDKANCHHRGSDGYSLGTTCITFTAVPEMTWANLLQMYAYIYIYTVHESVFYILHPYQREKVLFLCLDRKRKHLNST